MNKIELLENLIESAKIVSYENQDDFGELQKRTEMIIRKIFGDKSHYLDDINNVNYSAWGVIDENTDHRFFFDSGLKEFRNILGVMLEDIKLSSNYDETDKNIKKEKLKKTSLSKKTFEEIKVLISSPSDVKIERELLMDKLETIFRRNSHEERCGRRIIVDGWETLPSQPGYPQDLVNEDKVSKTDIVIAVFRHTLGTPTINLEDKSQRAPSGTAEELLLALGDKLKETPPIGMAYFYSVAPVISLDSTRFDHIKKEWERLKQFREGIKNKMWYKTYNIEEEILEIACKDLCENIIKYFNK